MQKQSKFITVLGALFLLLGGIAVQAQETKTITGLKTPESAIAGRDGRIYVSEINEFGKDGDGQISVIDKDGKLTVFATGMDDPKGLAMIGKDLYVADKVRVLKVAPDGKWQVFAAADAFPVTPQFLNDLESDRQGNLYVSDSGDLKKGGAVYRISKAGKVTLITDGKKDGRVLAPNGLLMDRRGKLLYVDFSSGILYRLNIASGEITQIAEGFGGADGIVRARNGLLYVSDWSNGKVFSVTEGGKVELIKDGFKSAADIALSADGKYLLVPDMKAGELVMLPLH
jgi:sugar lactone lactonase YvrE